ncbi:MAG: response regulator transcription factor [Ignavibacteriales bacterium]|jgi:two-component system response regulator DegU|nr:response regulator transcription factor [Ignavibacteriales bacterium]
MSKIRLILADDHPLLIQGLVSILRQEENIEVLGQASDGNDALELIRKFEPDIAILDIQMPEPGGLRIAELLQNGNKRTKIIVLTMFKEESLIKRVLKLGVRGYVLKENAIDDIIDSINIVYDGGIYLSNTVSEVIRDNSSDLISGSYQILTPSEKKILRLIGEGKSSKEIANELFISSKTVENHRGNICKKLGVTGFSALIKYALSNKMTLE